MDSVEVVRIIKDTLTNHPIYSIQDGANDDDEFTVGGETDEGLVIQPRWPTRVFAAQCLRKIIEGSRLLSFCFAIFWRSRKGRSAELNSMSSS